MSPNPDSYGIRLMRMYDIDLVVQIDQILFPTISWTFEDFYRAYLDPTWQCWILYSADPADPPILGYGLQNFNSNTNHIANLAIHPSQQGRGLGGLLLGHMIDYARWMNHSKMQLEVDTKNKRAIRLYEHFGFQKTEVIEHFYSIGNDAYVMQLCL